VILVTGSSGPFGNAFKSLKNANEFVFVDSSDFNLLNFDSSFNYIEKISKKFLISGVIHLAAKSGGAELSKNKPGTLFSENIIMVLNLLDVCKKLNISRVILTLSTTCYSSELIAPKENMIHSGPLLGADYSYGYAKRMFEPIMRSYNTEFGMKISCILVNGIIGPFMNFRDGESILPAALIKRFYGLKNGNEQLEVWGDGSPIREYTFSTDLAEATIWCFNNQEISTLLNIGSTEKVSVKQCAIEICLALDIEPDRLFFDSSKPNGRLIQNTSNTEFVSRSNFVYVKFSKMVYDTVRWYESALNSNIDFKR
jgi:GDP-L-fucose synthase